MVFILILRPDGRGQVTRVVSDYPETLIPGEWPASTALGSASPETTVAVWSAGGFGIGQAEKTHAGTITGTIAHKGASAPPQA